MIKKFKTQKNAKINYWIFPKVFCLWRTRIIVQGRKQDRWCLLNQSPRNSFNRLNFLTYRSSIVMTCYLRTFGRLFRRLFRNSWS